MSIISDNKKVKKAAQAEYIKQRNIRDEAAQLTAKKRKASQEIGEANKREEQAVIEEMFAFNTKEGLTAAELTRKMNGKLSRHEIAGNLTAANRRVSRYNKINGEVKTAQRKVVRYSIACDESGRPLENTKPVPKETKVTVYTFPNAKKTEPEEGASIGGLMVREMIKKYQENN